MKTSKPPRLATWILEHLVLATDKDVLAGDLLEEFEDRRSVGWYWRQVLIAVFVGFSKELSRQWRAAGFAVVWTLASVIALRLWYQSPLFHSMFGSALRHDWPESGVLTTALQFSPQILIFWLGLGLYLVMMHCFSATRFARGLIVSLFCMFLAFCVYVSGWWPIKNDTGWHLAIQFGHWTPDFLALLLSLCATLPSRAMKRTAIIPIPG